jgi:hypothetical protein
MPLPAGARECVFSLWIMKLLGPHIDGILFGTPISGIYNRYCGNRYIELVNGFFKPTNILGGTTLYFCQDACPLAIQHCTGRYFFEFGKL